MLIILNASRNSQITLIEMNKDEYSILIENICSDERVRKMWGEAGCKKQMEAWISLVT